MRILGRKWDGKFGIWDSIGMIRGGVFKGHGEGWGPRLRRQVALGPTGLARRYGAGLHGNAELEELLTPEQMGDVRRMEAAGAARGKPTKESPGRSVPSDRPPHGGKVVESAAGGKKQGRPRIEGVRPWEALGLSRTEFYRRKKAGAL